MSANITRRTMVGGIACAVLSHARSHAQGFAGLGSGAQGFADVTPGRVLTFPADHGPHPEFRIEWWYLTANLADSSGASYGAQWTLFRQAMSPDPQNEGWANQQVWMGHAAVTSADTHRFSETFARGGIGQAGVEASPLHAWIDAWAMKGSEPFASDALSPLDVSASGKDFSYSLKLDATKPLVLQGDAGYSRKSERGQASYYYSQPYFTARGSLVIDGKSIDVSGRAWLDREWSSQPLASDQIGWDWLSLHLGGDEKLMLFRLRQRDGANFFSGNWIGADGTSTQIESSAIEMTPTGTTTIGDRMLPTSWRVAIPSRGLAITITPLNSQAWMGTSFAYWEGPTRFEGSARGVGYLEMTGY